MSVSKLVMAFFLGSAALSAVGCVTETRQGMPEIAVDTKTAHPKSGREEDLRKKTETDPKDPKGWYEYGMYWDESSDFVQAARCFERLNELVDPNRWTTPNYLLGKVYLRLQDFERSMAHLNAVIKNESPDPKVSCLNPDFRESHLLRGFIYYEHKRWREARKDFLRFLELGGEDERVEELLERIDQEIK